VKWLDGPTTSQVRGITGRFQGAYFDGMIDYQGRRYLTLDGKPWYGTSWVTESRDYSPEAVEAAIAAVVAEFGLVRDPAWTAEAWEVGGLYQVPVAGVTGWDPRWNLQDAVGRHLQDWTAYPDGPAPSPTADRLQVVGDDGYGMGTRGSAANGWKGGEGYASLDQGLARAQGRELDSLLLGRV
jgi:hypothetical protein